MISMISACILLFFLGRLQNQYLLIKQISQIKMNIQNLKTCSLKKPQLQSDRTEADKKYAKAAKKLKKIVKSLKTPKEKQSQGSWSLTEEKEYIKFLKNYRRTLQRQMGKRKNRVYKKMSEFICTRTNTQCTSHHQKMMDKQKSIQAIIIAIKCACSLSQLQSDKESQESAQKKDDLNLSPERNIEDSLQKNRYLGYVQFPMLIAELQSIENQYQVFNQELRAEPIRCQLKYSEQIEEQQKNQEIMMQSQEWITYLNLS